MLHANIWSPDTCGCQIEFEFDDELPAETRTHTAKRIIKKCEVHSTSDIMDRHDHYDTVLKENQTKNIVHGHFLETFPEHTEDVTDTQNNSTHLMLPSGKNRVLHVSFVGANIPQNKKKDWEKKVHDRVGHNKVVVR